MKIARWICVAAAISCGLSSCFLIIQFLPFAKVERSRISRRGRIAGAARNVLVTTTERSDDSSGDGDKLLEENREFYYDQKDLSHNIHNYMFGDDHEAFISDPSFEHLTLCTEPAVFKHHLWSLVPFGLGMHACLGRRLALLRLVDAILYNFLNYNVTL